MKIRPGRSILSLLVLSVAPVAGAQARPGDINSILAQLDAASQRFKSAQADVQYDNYTRVVHAHDLETGSLYVERTGGGNGMGAIFYDLGPDGKPQKAPAKIIAFDGKSLQIFSPGVNQVDVFKAGANQAKYESFLTLGFGGSGHDLAKAWTIADQGSEIIDGVKTEKLALVSQDDSVKNTFTHVTVWLDLTRGLSLKQVFFAPSGDMRTATYTNVKLNTRIDKHPYAISKGATPIQH